MEGGNHDPARLKRIIDLDNRLKKQKQAIAQEQNLEEYTKGLSQDPTTWWWQLLKPIPKIHHRDRFDWLWNFLSAS